MSGRPVWKDATSYSRDDDRTPTAGRLSLSRDVVITIVSKHLYYPDEWVFHCRPWFDTFPLKLPGTPENRDEAQARAIALVREKISEIAAILREVN